MRRKRVGFSMIEIMVVIAILVVLASTTFPRISRWRKNYDLRSAKESIASTIATARAAAVQKGRPARVLPADQTSERRSRSWLPSSVRATFLGRPAQRTAHPTQRPAASWSLVLYGSTA